MLNVSHRRHALRRRRSLVAKRAISLAGISCRPLGLDSAGRGVLCCVVLCCVNLGDVVGCTVWCGEVSCGVVWCVEVGCVVSWCVMWCVLWRGVWWCVVWSGVIRDYETSRIYIILSSSTSSLLFYFHLLVSSCSFQFTSCSHLTNQFGP